MSQNTARGLVARGVTKVFNGNVALDRFDMDVAPGEVHALVGHNGSGKSTFIKVLAGFYPPDAGRVEVDGRQLRPGDPTSSAAVGLSFVHQTLGLVAGLSVLENLHLGKPYDVNRLGKINWRRERATAAAGLRRFGLVIDPRIPVGRLTTVERVEVAIVRALSLGEQISVLVLDEATAALTDQEVHRLFGTIRSVTAQGVGVIYVSHRLDEIPAIADTVSVLRDGRLIGRGPIADFSRDRLVELITAQHADAVPPLESAATGVAPAGPVALEIAHLDGPVLRDFSVAARRGEIIGVVGLVGSGVEELVAILAGRQHPTRGTLRIDGRPAQPGSLAALARRGFRVVVGEKNERIVPDLNAGENATLAVVRRYFRYGWLRLRRLRNRARSVLADFHVRPPDPGLRAGSLSGGNQQKLAMARVLQPEPSVLLLEEPFHGVDVQGRRELSDILRTQSRQGRLILIADSDLDEVLGICDRLIVLRDGRVAMVAEGAQTNKHKLLEACYGAGSA